MMAMSMQLYLQFNARWTAGWFVPPENCCWREPAVFVNL